MEIWRFYTYTHIHTQSILCAVLQMVTNCIYYSYTSQSQPTFTYKPDSKVGGTSNAKTWIFKKPTDYQNCQETFWKSGNISFLDVFSNNNQKHLNKINLVEHSPSIAYSYGCWNHGFQQPFLCVSLTSNWAVKPPKGSVRALLGKAGWLHRGGPRKVWQVTASQLSLGSSWPWARSPGRWRMVPHSFLTKVSVKRGPNLQFFCSCVFVSTDLLLPPPWLLPPLLPLALLVHILL